MSQKFKIYPDYEQWVFEQRPDCNIAFVESAYAIAAPIAQVSRELFMDAIRCGSYHAVDTAAYWDGRSKRGGATRLAFHSDSITAWAYDHAAHIVAVRQQTAARLNEYRNVTSHCSMTNIASIVSPGSAVSGGIMKTD